MLFYLKCPSCSRVISYNLQQYCEELENIRNDTKKTNVQKGKEAAALLDKYNYTMICCRNRIMGLIPYHKITVT